MAFAEVDAELDHHAPFVGVPRKELHVPPFMTLSNSMVLAQTLNGVLGRGQHDVCEGTLLYHNVAPRKDDMSVRVANRGEQFYFAKVRDKAVFIAGPASGFSWSMLVGFPIDIYDLPITKEGSQFRSRDYFPAMIADVLTGVVSLDHLERVDSSAIPPLPSNQVAYVDGFGNIKLTAGRLLLPAGEEVTVSLQVPYEKDNGMLGHQVVEHPAVIAHDSFAVSEGQLAYSMGSSSLCGSPAAELFLRGGSAAKLYGLHPRHLTDEMTMTIRHNGDVVQPAPLDGSTISTQASGDQPSRANVLAG